MSGGTNSVHDNHGDSDDMSLGYGSGEDDEYVQEMLEREPEALAEEEEEARQDSAAGSRSNARGPPEKRARASENPRHKHHCGWGSINAQPVRRHREIFASPAGPTRLSVVTASGIREGAVDIFKEIFTRDMTNPVVHRSNLFVQKIREGGEPATFRARYRRHRRRALRRRPHVTCTTSSDM
jgi:hypothetical protein